MTDRPHSRYPMAELRKMATAHQEIIRRERPSAKRLKFKPTFLRVWSDKCALVTPFSYVREDDGETVIDTHSELL